MKNQAITQGKNSEVIQQQNRLLVLRLIRKNTILSRVRIAELTGLKQATITNIINELLEMNYVKEAGLIKGSNGRRVKGIILNLDKMRILVARITNHYYAVGVYDLNGNCIKVEKHLWDQTHDFKHKMEDMKVNLLDYMSQDENIKKYIGAGIVIQESSIGLNNEFLPDDSNSLERYLEDYFTKALGIDIFINNVADMSAYFEWNSLSVEKEKVKILVCLIVGYSIDCAIIVDGEVIQGKNGRLGHFGHVSIDINGPFCECGNRGCIKNYISIDAIKARCEQLRELYPHSHLNKDSDIREFINAYYQKDLLARHLYEEMAYKLGVVLVNLINQFCPDEIIIGDEIPNNDEFIELIRENVRQRLPLKRFERTEICVFKQERKTKMDPGMRGMCLYVINQKLQNMKL